MTAKFNKVTLAWVNMDNAHKDMARKTLENRENRQNMALRNNLPKSFNRDYTRVSRLMTSTKDE